MKGVYLNPGGGGLADAQVRKHHKMEISRERGFGLNCALESNDEWSEVRSQKHGVRLWTSRATHCFPPLFSHNSV